MPVTAIIGAQWGDEGKGKISSMFCQKADICARYQGGANAGHCTIVEGVKHEFRVLPAGTVTARHVVVGNGVVIDLEKFLSEIDELAKHIPRIAERVTISLNAHVVTPAHIDLDRSQHSQKIGTTGAGVGPAYTDKIARKGIRVGDILSGTEQLLSQLGMDHIVRRFTDGFADKCTDTGDFLRRALDRGETIVAEGAQGTLLDVDHGDYPYVTSSNPTIGGVLTGLGVGAKDIANVYLVASSYMTKLGAGDFPTKLDNEVGKYLQERGREMDSSRNMMRDCGWFDLDLIQRAISLNRADGIILTKLDVLSGLSQVQLKSSKEGDNDGYIKLPGWSEDLSAMRRFDHLPKAAQDFVYCIEQVTRTPVVGLSVGPGINEYISKVEAF